MSELRLKVVDTDEVSFHSCGVESIDNLVRDAYLKTLFKQALAYNITVDGIVVGSCMMKFVTICDEEYYVGDSFYAALEITYIAIDTRFQRKGIGSVVLKQLIQEARKLSDIWPIRFLILEALRDREKWYTDAGFKKYPRQKDSEYADTVSMRMDFIDISKVEQYEGQLC